MFITGEFAALAHCTALPFVPLAGAPLWANDVVSLYHIETLKREDRLSVRVTHCLPSICITYIMLFLFLLLLGAGGAAFTEISKKLVCLVSRYAKGAQDIRFKFFTEASS